MGASAWQPVHPNYDISKESYHVLQELAEAEETEESCAKNLPSGEVRRKRLESRQQKSRKSSCHEENSKP